MKCTDSKSLLASHGGKRALITQLATALQCSMMTQRRFVRGFEAHPSPRLVFVCDGNICRSPFAQQVARSNGLSATSMGIRADPGARANERAVAIGLRMGFDLSGHVAKRFDPELIDDGDLVLVFELRQAVVVEQMLPRERRRQVRLIGAHAGWRTWHLQDPYGHSSDYFERCFRRIELSIRSWIPQTAKAERTA